MQVDRFLCFLKAETVFFHTLLKFVTVMKGMSLNTSGKCWMGTKNFKRQILKKIICCYVSNINSPNNWLSVMYTD